jgi:hypothetical protein
MDVLIRAEKVIVTEVKPYLWPLAVLALFILATFGPFAYSMLLTGDEWSTVFRPTGQAEWAVKIGRWGTRLIWDFTPFRYFNPPYITMLSAFAGLLFGLWAARLVGLKSVWAVTAFVGIFVLSPTWGMSYLFVLTQFSRALSIFFSLLAVWMALRFCNSTKFSGKRLFTAATSVVSLVVTASFYQAAFIYPIILFFLAQMASAILQPDKFNAIDFWKMRFPRFVALVLIALALYAFSVYAFRVLYGVDAGSVAGNYSALGLLSGLIANLQPRIKYVLDALLQFYLYDFHMVPAIFGWSVLIGLLIFVVAAKKISTKGVDSRIAWWLFILLSLGAVLILPFAFGFLRPLRLNMISSACLLFAFFVAFPIEYLKAGALRSLTAILAGFLIVTGGYQLSSAAVTKHFSNQLDLSLTHRLADQLFEGAHITGSNSEKILVLNVVGELSLNKKPPFIFEPSHKPFDTSMVNCGVFDCQTFRLSYALKLVGYQNPVEVKRISREDGKLWLTENLQPAELDQLHRVDSWYEDPINGVFFSDGEALLVLSGFELIRNNKVLR